MPPKSSQASQQGQQSLFSFFKKGQSAPSSSPRPPTADTTSHVTNGARIASAASLATPPLTTAKKSSADSNGSENPSNHSTPLASKRSVAAPHASSLSTPPITSEPDAMEQEPIEPKVHDSSPQSVPAKRDRAEGEDSDDEEEKEQLVVRKKRAAVTKASKIIESDDSDDESVRVVTPKKATSQKNGKRKGKGKKKMADEDDFVVSDAASEEFFNDDLDEALADLSDPEPPVRKPKSSASKPKASTSAPARPPPKPLVGKGASGSGSAAFKTQAELQKIKEKETKQANEQVFSFLVDPKDADGVRPGEEGYDPRTLRIPSSAWEKFTPFEKQFWEIKSTHYDTVLFFQKGKFYELYEEDASIGHREFDLKLTDRVKMRMVGVPESHFDYWAAKFLAKGYKVGRVDQQETALGAELRAKDAKTKGKGAGKSIVRRELNSVLTTGTIVDGAMLTDDLSNHCVSIKEETPTASSQPHFGVCVLDASTAEFSLSYLEDDASRTQIETLIRQLKPKEIVHEKGNLSVSTLRLLRNCLSLDCQWTQLKPRTEFLEPEETKSELQKLFASNGTKGDMDVDQESEEVKRDEEAIPESIRKMYSKPLAMSALGGMIWYLRQLNLDTDLVTVKNFNIYDPLSQGKALILDGQTLAHIEVLQNSQGGSEGTLLQLLSRCVTPFGKRLFKIWLCAPLREASAINDRLDAVDDLIASQNFSSRFDKMAKGIPDLERMLARIHAKTCKKEEFLKVVAAFAQLAAGLEDLAEYAESFKSTGVPGLLRGAPTIKGLLENVESLYEGEELLPVEGVNDAFEAVRTKVTDIEKKLKKALKKYEDDLGVELSYRDIGTKEIYQIQVPAKTKVPGNWTKMSSTKEYNRYWSPEVTKLVNELKEARERKLAVVNEFQFTVYGEFDQDYAQWMQTVKIVAELDCLLSLSKSSAALGEPCVRPEIVEADTALVEFEELRHPCLLGSMTDFIPNDVALGDEAQQMILLTGPNMAGKSTLLRMTCAAVIMAQLGCYVPASKARIAPLDAIYSRMGASDFIFQSASTFKVEMDDCNKILTKSTPKSLVILDELGRGTSTYDGMAIAFAVLHRLATHVGCIGFFATHFTSLTDDFAYHPQIRLCNMQTQIAEQNHAVVFLYKLVAGVAQKSYGPAVASMAGMPDILVSRAIDISKQFEQASRAKERASRLHELLPLPLQADAAFLTRFAKLELGNPDQRQLLRTLAIIRDSVKMLKA